MSYNLDPKKMTNEDWLLTNCKEHSLYIIQNYPKTEKQLRDKLKQNKKYNDNIIDATIKFLKKYNYINDEEYAKRFVELNSNKKTLKVIKEKLYIKGVEKNIIDKVINEAQDNFDEDAVAKKILLKKYPKFYEIIDDINIKQKQKIFQYLMRKGISYNIILNIIKENEY